MLIVDLGQSGSRYQVGAEKISLLRGKSSSESIYDSLQEVFSLIPFTQSETVAL